MRHLANAITYLRLALSIPISWLVIAGSGPALLCSALLFTLAGLTDLLDGYVARRSGHVSSLGAFMDPAADKVVVNACLLALVWQGAFPLPLATALILRDLAVTLLRLIFKRRRPLMPGWMAKVKTGAFYVGVTGILFAHAARAAPVRHLADPLILDLSVLDLSVLDLSVLDLSVLDLSWLCIGVASLLSIASAAEYLIKAASKPPAPVVAAPS